MAAGQSTVRAETAPQIDGGRARLSERLQAIHRTRPADEQGGQRRQGHRLEHQDEAKQLAELNGG